MESPSNVRSSASAQQNIIALSHESEQDKSLSQGIKSIAIVSSYLPRKCGIATFTNDLCSSLENADWNSPRTDIIAINDGLEEYQYSSKVKFEITSDSSQDYLRAAEYVNKTGYDAVLLQHEFGLFDGMFGEYILDFARRVKTPLYTVLHSVLKHPGSEQYRIIRELSRNSQRLIVMSLMASEMLEEIYSINPKYICMIHHGVPDIPREGIQRCKERLKFANKKILMSFGLIGPGKGYEYVIDALLAIVTDHPDVFYIIAGTLHPHIYRSDNDTYLNQLKERIHKNKMDHHVLMYNHYIKTEELYGLLNATDIFVAPYLCQEQSASGTLACAMACGRAIVSTPTWYAQEVLAQNRGLLVPFRDSQTLAREISKLLFDSAKRQAMSKCTYEYSRRMLWKNVSKEYLYMLNSNHEPGFSTERVRSYHSRNSRLESLPPIKLKHLLTLTDTTGIIQHSKYSIACRQSGYCVDDAARALLTVNKYYRLFHDESVLQYLKCYFNFLKHAFNEKAGCFRNVLNTEGEWDGETGSQDAQGRALWGLSALIESAPTRELFCQAKELFLRSLSAVNDFNYPRPWAFSILGMYRYLKVFPNDTKVLNLLEETTYKLFDLYQSHRTDSWQWFEDKLTYANAKLPHALLLGSNYLNLPDISAEALQSLKWLIHIQTSPKGHLSVIGNKKWWFRDGTGSHFDQQPLEAMALVHSCADCFRLTWDSAWRDYAYWGFQWFLGENDIGQPMYDRETGAGYDGFSATERNENQGTEATMAWLFSWLEIFDISNEQGNF
jgi:glycosyltransferase involved in cell wall biosynthesis